MNSPAEITYNPAQNLTDRVLDRVSREIGFTDLMTAEEWRMIALSTHRGAAHREEMGDWHVYTTFLRLGLIERWTNGRKRETVKLTARGRDLAARSIAFERALRARHMSRQDFQAWEASAL